MKNELVQLYNTLLTIETKGQSSLIMADCVKFLAQLINSCDEDKKKAAEDTPEKKPAASRAKKGAK